MENWQFYLFLILIGLIVQGFYAMLEMAAVSFNKVRLQYYVSKNDRRAIWLSRLINNPAQLFGTTLICITTALQVGSEAARHFYISIGLSPDWAPLSQVLLVLIFAEIAPMFAGRRYPESAAWFGIPILFVSSIILRPLIWFFDLLCQICNRLVGSPGHGGLYLSREELQNVLEERSESGPAEELDITVRHIFSLKNRTAQEWMEPLSSFPSILPLCTVGELRAVFQHADFPFALMINRTPQNVLGIVYPRDLLRLPDSQKLREYARSPWFITENNSILHILKQFQRNNQSVAIVLNENGVAIGVLTLDAIMDEIFGQGDDWQSVDENLPRTQKILVEKNFPGDTRLEDFNLEFNLNLHYENAETLEELMIQLLGHPPAKGESVVIGGFELRVKEASLLGAKTISVKSI